MINKLGCHAPGEAKTPPTKGGGVHVTAEVSDLA
jgi:hypothetical protein